MIENAFIPLFLCGVALYAKYRKVEVFQTFTEGAEQGLRMAVSLLPIMIGMVTVVYMLRASGAIAWLGDRLAPLFFHLGIPQECGMLVLLKPISGGGSLAVGSEVIGRFGADSRIGRTAAVMMGAGETSLYTIGIYSEHIHLTRTRYAVPAALVGDLVAFLLAAYSTAFFYN